MKKGMTYNGNIRCFTSYIIYFGFYFTYCINNIVETGEIWNNTDNGAQSTNPFKNATVTMNVGPGITNILVEK